MLVLFLLASAGGRTCAWQSPMNSSTESALSMIAVGATAVGILSTVGEYQLQEQVGQGEGVMITLLAMVGTSVVAGTSGNNITEITAKRLVHRTKVDHDIYLAGGEMTPFLQSVYREVRLRSQELQLKDGPCVGSEIDEARMTEAIDRLAALAVAQ